MMARLTTRLKIDENTLKMWRQFHQVGDAVKIADKAGFTPEAVRLAFKEGRANSKITAHITAFYEARKKMLYEQA